MARFFKYKTPSDVTADAATLGYDIPATEDLAPLFQPVAVGDRTVGNRFAIHPMEGCDGTLEGHPDELTYRRYLRFGAGGAKLIWGEATAIADDGRMNSRQLLINDANAAGLEKMLADCRAAHRKSVGDDADLLLGLQLTHSGRFSFRKPKIACHDPILDPITLDKSTGKFIDASYPVLTDDDLKRIEDQYLAAARLAAKVGCDFIDLKQCHRYLLSELLGAKNRPGEYGGSFENRTRLIRNITQRIAAELPELILATRFNAYDGIPYRSRAEDKIGEPYPHELPLQVAFGTNPENHREELLDEPVQLAENMKQWGMQLLSVSMGNPYANPHIVRPAEFPPVDGYHSPEHPLDGIARHFRIARRIQQAVGEVPVVGSGYSWLQDFAPHVGAANVANGSIAFVGFGRATLSHPDFVKTIQETGSLNRKKVCRTFSYCTNLMRAKHNELGQYATGCPPFDKEVYGPLWDEVKQSAESQDA